MESRKRKRLVLDSSRKREIVKYAELHSKCSQQDIANHFSVLWDYDVKRRTVGDILSQKNKWNTDDNERPFKMRKLAKHSDMEEALFLWFSNVRSKNVTVTDDILRAKAKEFGKELNVSDFAYSNGWLQRFKTRHSIGNHVISGESAGVDRELVSDGREIAASVVKGYNLCDVFNMDETGLFFRMLPDKSLSTNDKVKGCKKIKDRITVALCSNADGSEKLKPLVIGKSENPRCFKSFNHKLYIIDLIDSDKSPALALSDAIRYVKRAWDNVTPTTILHCWQHTEIIPRDPTSTTTTTVEAAPNTTDKVTPLLNIVIEKLQIEPGVRMSVTEFMDVDHNCETMNDLSDADIIKSVRTDETSETEAEEDEDDIPEEPMPTAKEVRTGLKALQRLFEKSRHSNETDVNMFFDMQERANQLLLFGSHQTSITSFFKDS